MTATKPKVYRSPAYKKNNAAHNKDKRLQKKADREKAERQREQTNRRANRSYHRKQERRRADRLELEVLRLRNQNAVAQQPAPLVDPPPTTPDQAGRPPLQYSAPRQNPVQQQHFGTPQTPLTPQQTYSLNIVDKLSESRANTAAEIKDLGAILAEKLLVNSQAAADEITAHVKS